MRILHSCLAAAVLFAPPLSVAAASDAHARTLKDQVYLTVEGRPLHLDAYIHPDAAKTPGPVLVHLHGGGWARGARPESWTGFRPYLEAGFSVVTVEYRLAGEAPAPAAVQDARCALHWIAAHAEGLGLDPKRIVVSGTSAGGHLALMAGLLPAGHDIDRDECRDPPRPAAILDFYGPTDLTTLRPGTEALHPTVANWVGVRDDATAMARRMSPVNWLSAVSPPVFIVHGDADPIVPLAQSTDLKRRLDFLAVPSDLFVVAGGGHGKFDPASQSAVTARALAFLCAQAVPAATACKNAVAAH